MCDRADGCVTELMDVWQSWWMCISYCLSCGSVHTCLHHTYPVIINNRLHKRDSTKSAELKKLMIFVLDAHVSPYSPTYIHVSPYSPTYIHVSPYSPTYIHVSPYSPTSIHVSPYSTTSIHVSPYSPTSIHVSPYSPTSIHVLYMCSFTFIHGKCCWLCVCSFG